MQIRHLLVACVLPALVACSDRGVDADGVDFGWGPRQAEQCTRAGGYESNAFGPFCQFNTADAGRLCRDSSECEGACLAVPPGGEIEPPPVGTRAMGQCSIVRHVMGCRTQVVGGAVDDEICIN